MVVKDNYLTLKSLEINTPATKIAGIGWLDFNKKDINLDITMTTTAGVHLARFHYWDMFLRGKKKIRQRPFRFQVILRIRKYSTQQ